MLWKPKKSLSLDQLKLVESSSKCMPDRTNYLNAYSTGFSVCGAVS